MSGESHSELGRMSDLVAQYDSFEDPYLKSEFLVARGMTYAVIQECWRHIAADRALAAAVDPRPVEADVLRPAARTTKRGRRRRPRASAAVAPSPCRTACRRYHVTVVITARFTIELL